MSASLYHKRSHKELNRTGEQSIHMKCKENHLNNCKSLDGSTRQKIVRRGESNKFKNKSIRRIDRLKMQMEMSRTEMAMNDRTKTTNDRTILIGDIEQNINALSVSTPLFDFKGYG
jgi:hypothetical protein